MRPETILIFLILVVGSSLATYRVSESRRLERYFAFRKETRVKRKISIKKADESFEFLILILISTLQAGQSLYLGLKRVEEEIDGEFGRAITRVNQLLETGQSVPKALRTTGKETGMSQFLQLAESLEIHFKTGGSMLEILRSLSEQKRHIRVLQGQFEAKIVETKLSAIFLAALPVLFLLFFVFGQREVFLATLNDPLGKMGLIYACISWVIGILLLRTLVHKEQERIRQ